MLVVSRKAKQTIRIGDDVTITVVRVNGNTVRIGIEAPEDIRVIRGELKDLPPKGSEPCASESVTSEQTGNNESPNPPNEKTKTKEAA